MGTRLLRVALTGGIATGKSYCAKQLAALGAPIVDADALARAAVAPGSDALRAIVSRFGRQVLSKDGSLNRSALGGIVFADATRRAELEAIVHPIVYAGIRDWLNDLERQQTSGRAIGVASIPLLYETGHQGDFDLVVVAACSPDHQLERLMARDHLSIDEARLRVTSQWPIGEKMRRADHVIDTSGSFESTDRQVAEVWGSLQLS